MKLPLRNRLPNPPAIFVGRAQEQADLAAALTRAKATVVQGHPGIGRLSIVVSALRARFPQDVERCAYFERPDEDDGPWLQRELVRALDVPDGDAKTLAEAALEIAEREKLWLVIRDADGDDEPIAVALLKAALRHARASRVIVIARAAPALDLAAGQVIVVKGLDDAALRELARQALPDANEPTVARAIAEANGSPRRLLQGDKKTGAATLVGVPSEGRAFLEALAVLGSAQVAETLAAIVSLPPPAVLDLLERRRLIVRRHDRLALHPEARVLGIPRLNAAKRKELQARACQGLAKVKDPAAAIELLRLHTALGARAAADALAKARGKELAALGYGELLPAPLEAPAGSEGRRIHDVATEALALAQAGHVAQADRALLSIEELPAATCSLSYRRAIAACQVARGRPLDAQLRTPEAWEAQLFAGHLETLDKALSDEWPRERDTIAARLALLRDEPLPKGSGDGYALAAARHAARRGQAVKPPAAKTPVAQIQAALAAAELAFATQKKADTAAAVQLAEQHDLTAWLLEALEVAADVTLDADRLHKVAAHVSSARWRWTSALYTACTARDGLDGAALLAIATKERSTSPLASRRARLLLGADGGDAVDRAFVAKVVAQSPRHARQLVRTVARWQPPLVLDDAKKHVLATGDRCVDLSDSALLWRCLRALCTSGGAIEKSALYCSAWNETEFHPLRHNNRLHTTINKLRTLLAPLSDESLLVTTDDGYALAPALPVVWLGPLTAR